VDSVIPSLSAHVHGQISVSLCKISVCQNKCPKNLLVEAGAYYTINEVVHLGLAVSASLFEKSSAFETEIKTAFLSCSQSRENSGKVFLING